VNLVDPLIPALHGELGDLMMEAGRPAEALGEFTVALALDPHDRATAHYRLARAHHALGDRAASQDEVLAALDVAPNYRPAQRLLMELMRADGGSGQNRE
ncbi:MAG: tetratricopeptide repeat protein, partial [Gammaproteobacteria bacterium]|nr:tetratricopeptide repeat protein [Gammaproteobacteria bacterium]